MAIAITAVLFGGIITGYIQASRRAEWSGYSLAAQALATQQLEQARSAKWDVSSIPAVDELTNIPPVTSAVLDLPVMGTNIVRATNYTTVSLVAISTVPLITIHLVEVNTVWPFGGKLFTNTAADYFAPD